MMVHQTNNYASYLPGISDFSLRSHQLNHAHQTILDCSHACLIKIDATTVLHTYLTYLISHYGHINLITLTRPCLTALMPVSIKLKTDEIATNCKLSRLMSNLNEGPRSYTSQHVCRVWRADCIVIYTRHLD
jgi:hypothetical protein